MSATRKNPRLARCVSAAVEQLETRAMMSVTVTEITDSEGNRGLFIRGNSAADNVQIIDNADGTGTVTATGMAPMNFTDRTIFDVDLGGGNDTLEYRVTGELNGAADDDGDGEIDEDAGERSLHLDGGTGNDVILINVLESLRNGADLDILIDGDTGNDTITTRFEYMYDSKLDLDIIAGEGNDNLVIDTPEFLEGDTAIPGPGTGGGAGNSIALVDIDLGGGRNTLNMTVASIYYDSTLDVDVRGGNSTGSSFDTVNIDMNDYVQGKFFVDVSLMGGDDRLNITAEAFLYTDLYGNQSGTATARFNLNGGDGNDRMSFVSDYIYLDPTSYLSIKMNGGNGNDTLTFDTEDNIDEVDDGTGNMVVEGDIEVLAGGILIVNVDGQNGNDTINAQLSFTDASDFGGFGPGSVDIALKGGQQMDRFNVSGNDQTVSGVNFFTGGSILIDGQSNTDTLDFITGTNETLYRVRNIENVLA